MDGFFIHKNQDYIEKTALKFVQNEFKSIANGPIVYNFYTHKEDLPFPTEEKSIFWDENIKYISNYTIPNMDGPVGLLLIFQFGNMGSIILSKSVIYYKISKVLSKIFLVYKEKWLFISESEKLELRLNKDLTLLNRINRDICYKEEIFGKFIINSPAIFIADLNLQRYLFLSNIPYLYSPKVSLCLDHTIDIINDIYNISVSI